MTLRQVLEILWQRKLLVIATVILAVAAAVAYMKYSVKTFEATAIVKLNGAATASSDTSSTYAGIELDTDIDSIMSTAVLSPAAQDLGESDIPGLTGSLKVDVTEGVRTNKISIHAVGGSPVQAQTRSNAVASAYVAYLSNQVERGKQRLMDDKASAAKEVRRYQNQLDQDKNNSVLETYQEQAIARLGQIQGQLDQVEMAGYPAVVQKEATLGTSTSITPMTILGIGLLSGILAGAGVALIREQFDERLHSTKETERATGEPILAEVAVDRRRRKKDMSLPTALGRATAFTESIRTLRTSLQVLAPSHAVVAVTSPEPGDGKSFVTANLAVSMALAGRSVIVVGGDLRQGRIGQYFGTKPDVRGFAEAIASDADATALSQLLCRTGHEGLMLLPPGWTKAEPADLLATDALPRVIGRLREMADVVLIDTPPALALADAAILAAQADGVIVLSSVGRTQRETLLATLRVLRANAAHIYGVVSNRSRRSMPKTYDGYLGAAAAWDAQLRPKSRKWSRDTEPRSTRVIDAGQSSSEQLLSVPVSAAKAGNPSDGYLQTEYPETEIAKAEFAATGLAEAELVDNGLLDHEHHVGGLSTDEDVRVVFDKKLHVPDDVQGSEEQPEPKMHGVDADQVPEPEQVFERHQEHKTVHDWDLYILEYPPIRGEPKLRTENDGLNWSWDWELDNLDRQGGSVATGITAEAGLEPQRGADWRTDESFNRNEHEANGHEETRVQVR